MSSVEPSTRVDVTSIAISGGKSVSASWLNCDSQEMSAPRSTIPCDASMIVLAFASLLAFA